MPRMEDKVNFQKNIENVVNTEQDDWKTTEGDIRILGTVRTTDDDEKDCSPNVGEQYDSYSRRIPDTTGKTNETLSFLPSSHRRKTSPVKIDTTACKDSNSLCASESSSLPSPLPSHFANHDNLFNQEPHRRKTIAFLSASNRSLDQNPAGYGNIKYTSLKSEMRKRSKTEQASKRVNRLGLTTLNQRGTFSTPKEKKPLKKEDKKHLSSLGIHEEVFESSLLGEWIVTDLDLNIYEMKQAQDVTYLREKRKQKRFSIFGLRRCWII